MHLSLFLWALNHDISVLYAFYFNLIFLILHLQEPFKYMDKFVVSPCLFQVRHMQIPPTCLAAQSVW